MDLHFVRILGIEYGRIIAWRKSQIGSHVNAKNVCLRIPPYCAITVEKAVLTIFCNSVVEDATHSFL